MCGVHRLDWGKLKYNYHCEQVQEASFDFIENDDDPSSSDPIDSVR